MPRLLRNPLRSLEQLRDRIDRLFREPRGQAQNQLSFELSLARVAEPVSLLVQEALAALGIKVTVNKVRLYIRSDFPHDTYWTNATLQFSDGTSQDIVLKKTSEPQEYTFPEKKIRWIQLANFKQPTQPLGFAAVTEMEVYGKDTPQP